jgi:hypothetical protein
MAWEIAKGILIAVAILFIVVPLALAMLYLVGVVVVSIPGATYGGIKKLPSAIKRTMKNPATLKLTSSSKGWVLPFTNGQASLVVCVFALLVLVLLLVHGVFD